MGLDAFVQCNCYQQGKTKPFPRPDLEKYVRMGDDGTLILDLDYDDHEEAHQMFEAWQADACEHSGMKVVFERISNWSGYRAFQEALSKIGWQNFPTLEEELPSLNGGAMPVAASVKALEELALFKEKIRQQTNTFLVNTETGSVVFEHIAVYYGIFMWAGDEKLNFGFNRTGFFIAEQHPDSAVRNGRILFQAQHLEQRLLLPDENGQRVEYYSADTEDRFVCRSITAGTAENYPRLLHIEERRLSADDFEYILEPLEIVCKASISTGNPVMWC
jgi:hypothetical protein